MTKNKTKENVVEDKSTAYAIVKHLIELYESGIRRVTIGYLLDVSFKPLYNTAHAASPTMFERLVYELADVRGAKKYPDNAYYYVRRWRAFCGYALYSDTQKRKGNTSIEVNINYMILCALRDQWPTLNGRKCWHEAIFTCA